MSPRRHHHSNFLEHAAREQYNLEDLAEGRAGRWKRRRHHHQHHRRQHHVPSESLASLDATLMRESALLQDHGGAPREIARAEDVRAEEGALLQEQEGALREDEVPPEGVRAEDVYAHSHPLVVDSLDAMGDKLKELKGEEGAASRVQDQLETSQQDAMKDMNSGVTLQRMMMGAKADVFVQEKVLVKLHDQEDRLTQQHQGVTQKLKAIMEPRIATVEQLVQKRRQAIGKSEDEVQHWDKKTAQYKQSALQTIVKRKVTLQTLTEAEAAIAEAQKHEAQAKRDYDEARVRVSRAVEEYKLAQTKEGAAGSKVVDRKEDEKLAEVSLGKAHDIYKVEQDRIDAALRYSQANLARRIKFAEKQREKAKRRFRSAKERLKTWKGEQRELVKKAAVLRKQYEGETDELDANRAKVLSTATNQAGKQAVSKSDWAWDDWAWGQYGDVEHGDEQDVEDVSLDA